MPKTTEALETLLREGQALLQALRNEYHSARGQADFDVNDFLPRFIDETNAWIRRVQSILIDGFESRVPSVNFENAPVSPVRQAGTNVKWGNLEALLQSRVAALAKILSDADPQSVVPQFDSKTVFLVHGRNTTWNKKIESFLGGLGLATIVLEDQENLGATIIEKLETNANVHTAVVLATADDVGCLEREKDTLGLKPRTRQNVLIELGYFFGKMGRGRVCLLFDPAIDIPSDLSGIVFTQISISDGHVWKKSLRRELLAMGMQI